MEENKKATEVQENTNEKTFEEMETKWDKVWNAWDKVRMWCYFIPLTTTISLLISIFLDIPANSAIETYIIMPLTLIGWIAAILTGPIRLFTPIVKWTIAGWKIGFMVPIFPICFMTGFMGASIGFGLMGYVLLFAPAILTIYYFFTDEI